MRLLVLLLLLPAVAAGQEVNVNQTVTAQGGAYYYTHIDPPELCPDPGPNYCTRHTTQHKAQESAGNLSAANPEATVTFSSNVVWEVETYVDFPDLPQPEPEEPELVGPVQIPGAARWQAVPDNLLTRTFRVLNDDWQITSDNLWLYAYNVSVDDGTGWIVSRPAAWYRNNYVQSETTPLTDEQVVALITKLEGE